MKLFQRLLTLGCTRVFSGRSPKNKNNWRQVAHTASGAVRENRPSGTPVPRLNLIVRTTVGGNELKAACRTSAAGRGALSHNHVPTMSASSEPRSEEDHVLTVKEVAARFRVCRRTIEREIAARRFPAPIRIGRALRFRESDLVAFEEKSKSEPLTPALS